MSENYTGNSGSQRGLRATGPLGSVIKLQVQCHLAVGTPPLGAAASGQITCEGKREANWGKHGSAGTAHPVGVNRYVISGTF